MIKKKHYKHKLIAIELLKPYVNNARTHTENQVNQVIASIKEFGFTNPILIDEDFGVIAGHCRLLAAKLLDYKEVSTITLNGLSKTQRKAYIIADNQLALNAGWDMELLNIEIDELKGLDFDIDLLGFEDGFFDDTDLHSELKEESYVEKYNIIIECEDEENQELIYDKLSKEGYSCQVQSL